MYATFVLHNNLYSWLLQFQMCRQMYKWAANNMTINKACLIWMNDGNEIKIIST